MEDAESMRLQDLRQVHNSAQPCCIGWNIYTQNRVARLAGCNQVADRANPADARHERWHFVERPVLAELFEAAQLRDVQACIRHLAVVTQLDGHLGVALDTCNRVDNNSL